MTEDELDIDVDKINWKYVAYGMLVICLLIAGISGFKLYKIWDCKQDNGFFMDDDRCYIPKNEAERQQMLEQGFIRTGWSVDDVMENWSLGG